MTYSKPRFGKSFFLSVVTVSVVVALVLTSQISMALMPVLGVGGLYVQADVLGGNDGTIYPEHGGITGDPHTTTPGCDSHRPMIVFELGDAIVDGFEIRKDLRVPHLDRYMSITIDEPDGFLVGDTLSVYLTQLEADYLELVNIELYEGGPDGTGGSPWGEESSVFRMEGGFNTDDNTFGVVAVDAEFWAHAMTGEQIAFVADEGSTINVELEYLTSSELNDYYYDRLGYNLPEYPDYQNPQHPAQVTDRDEYFTCNP